MFETNFNPKVSIILLHWKDYDDTKKCINSILNSVYSNYEIIVVDNFSNDGSVELLISEYSDVIFIYNEENFGFSKGVNQGLKFAYNNGSEWFLILNNDMIVDTEFLKNTIKEIPNLNNIGAITGKILYQHSRNIFWQAGGHIDMLKFQGIPRGKDIEDNGQYNIISKTGWASGAMSLIPRKTIDLVGYLPEEYFFGQEEWDYSISILKNKLNIYYVPDFKAYHKAGGSYKPGHPILNIYGGYLNKMICAKKFLPKLIWPFWKLSFFIYLNLVFPRIAYKICSNTIDAKLYIKAAKCAFNDINIYSKVDLEVLKKAYLKLGTTPTWGDTWAS
jgi:GT2 family glycosyltransferase